MSASKLCSPMRWNALVSAVALLPVIAAAVPGDTEWISIKDSDGRTASWSTTYKMSDDGRYVIFSSGDSGVSTTPVGPDTHNVYVRDRFSRSNELVNAGLVGTEFYAAGLSGDGRYALFTGARDASGGGIYLRDRVSGTTTLLERTGIFAAMSRNARYVAFTSNATNLVAGDTNGKTDVFLRDRQASTVERVSIATGGTQGDAASYYPLGVSDDGRFVLFDSKASNLAPGDANGSTDVFVRDRLNRTTIRVSARADGSGGNAESYLGAITPDGHWVAFISSSSDLVPGDSNGAEDTFVRDLRTGQVERVSLTSTGGQISRSFPVTPGISDDGRIVTFTSSDPRVVSGDTNRAHDVFVRDRKVQTSQRVNVASDGTQANKESTESSVSGDGRVVTFTSYATNLDPHDNSYWPDVYAHERTDALPETLVVKPTVLRFGEVTVGKTSATQTVTVTNTGTVPLALPWVNLRGYDAAEFRCVRNCPDTLPAGTSCTIDTRFVPISAGAKQARLVISTGPDGVRKKVWLRGTGL